MPAIKIPGTDKIIFVPNHIGDYVIDMTNYPDVDDTIRQEDVKVIGEWSDYTGSGKIGPYEVFYQGIQEVDPRSLKGQVEDSEIERTDRGSNASNKRQRNKLIYIEL